MPFSKVSVLLVFYLKKTNYGLSTCVITPLPMKYNFNTKKGLQISNFPFILSLNPINKK
jgi:hypothetical protein